MNNTVIYIQNRCISLTAFTIIIPIIIIIIIIICFYSFQCICNEILMFLYTVFNLISFRHFSLYSSTFLRCRLSIAKIWNLNKWNYSKCNAVIFVFEDIPFRNIVAKQITAIKEQQRIFQPFSYPNSISYWLDLFAVTTIT